jgi:cyclopropane fatty-acyl-phospholipid synthase-like methyltransferase
MPETSSGYYFTAESVREYIDMSEGFDGCEIIKKLNAVLPAGSSVLELGMGPGRDLKILGERYTATGSDLSDLFIDLYRQDNKEADLLVLDAISLATDRTFDALYSNKVLQHLSDSELERSVRRQAEIIADRGIVCHTFWEGQGEEFVEDLRFNYQTETDLLRLFSASFVILEISIYKEIRDNDSILIIAQKKK